MNKIVVTGGAGFIGSHLCQYLVKDPNNKVYSIDNYFTGSEENHFEGVTYIKGTASEIENLIDFTPSIIYHLGEYSRVEQSFSDIQTVWDYNSKSIFAILEFVRKTGCKLLYAGSSTKYGDKGAGKWSCPYAWSKATNTELVNSYGKWFNIDFAITYFYNVYGPREISNGKYATLIGIFTEKMKKGEDLTVVQPGTQQRNFTHINDLIEGLVRIGENGKGDDYGIGNPKSYTILEVAEIFGGKIRMIPERKGNRLTAEVRIEKTKSLGWEAKEDLKDYIFNLRQNNWDIK